MNTCEACCKKYGDLESHWERQPLCKNWIEKIKSCSIAKYLEDKLRDDTKENEEDKEFKCLSCGKKYTNLGNLNKHLRNSVICQKWSNYKSLEKIKEYVKDGEEFFIENEVNIAGYDKQNNYNNLNSMELIREKKRSLGQYLKKFDNVFTTDEYLQNFDVLNSNYKQEIDNDEHLINEKFVAPKYRLMHIIWNIFLIDKTFQLTDEIVKENNIAHIYAILPNENEYKQNVDCPCSILLYEGHSTYLDTKLFDEKIEELEKYRKERKNIFVYCNNGYQRSLPFICYYLTKHHQDEVPNVEKAIDIILPQVDKENYAKLRGKLIEQIERIFEENKIL